MPHLERIRIAGFKSIRDQTVELNALNVLIGANGAGKSNFIGAFELLNRILERELQIFVAKAGGASRLLHHGPKATDRIELVLHFRSEVGSGNYWSVLVQSTDDSLVFAKESAVLNPVTGPPSGYSYNPFADSGHRETRLSKEKEGPGSQAHKIVHRALESWRIYHFHDTSPTANIKQTADVDDNRYLRADAGNLAPLLYLLQEKKPEVYANIRDTIRLAAPFFADFDLEPDRRNPDKIKLEWRERGSDAYFDASSLSDGTLRFMALATLLLQPELPSTVLLDEPELGLHPYAIAVLADLLRAAAARTQVVVSTQSVTLINQLAPEDLIVVDRVDGASEFRRLGSDEIGAWMDEYALGELWEKNVLGGRPAS